MNKTINEIETIKQTIKKFEIVEEILKPINRGMQKNKTFENIHKKRCNTLLSTTHNLKGYFQRLLDIKLEENKGVKK